MYFYIEITLEFLALMSSGRRVDSHGDRLMKFAKRSNSAFTEAIVASFLF